MLWGVVSHFAGIDLSDEALTSGAEDSAENAMGNLFEDLMHRSFSENGQVAGEYYTPREVIRLMVDILLILTTTAFRALHQRVLSMTQQQAPAGCCW